MASVVGMAYISGVIVITCVVVKLASIWVFTKKKKKKNQWPVSLCVVVVVVVLVIVAVWHDTEVEHALPMAGQRWMVWVGHVTLISYILVAYYGSLVKQSVSLWCVM